jgi:hypothetical protein
MTIFTQGEVQEKLKAANLGDVVDTDIGRDGWIELTVHAPDTTTATKTMAAVANALRGVTNVDINLDYVPMAEPVTSEASAPGF